MLTPTNAMSLSSHCIHCFINRRLTKRRTTEVTDLMIMFHVNHVSGLMLPRKREVGHGGGDGKKKP